MVTLVVVMGPSGCGKSTIGCLLSKRLEVPFVEGDDFHPKVNIEKMSNGIPLNDHDRWPWLSLIRDYCTNKANELKKNSTTSPIMVLTCSALKKTYRDYLRNIPSVDRTIFIYPKGSMSLIKERLNKREPHFMKSSMLDSQFATLESPESEDNVFTVDIEDTCESIIQQIINKALFL